MVRTNVRGGVGGGDGGVSGGGSGGGRMQSLERQLQEIEQQVAQKHGGPRGGGSTMPGADGASQAVLMAELQTVRHLLTDASMAMAETAQDKQQLEEELNGAMDELRAAKQSWQAAEMSLRVQSETAERLNAQVSQLTEDLRIARDTTNVWRTKAEETRLELERRAGSDSGGASKKDMNDLQAALAEANRLRLLDGEKLATQTAELERLTELEERARKAENTIKTLRTESDDWRAKSEGFAAELLAWRAKSESWEATKAQSVRALQSERDRLQTEWQMMRESLQSAEASLAVQTAAVQRLEQELQEDRTKLREAVRADEDWVEKEEKWKTHVLTMRTQMESEATNKDRMIEKLRGEKHELEQTTSELSAAMHSAEASLAVQTAAVQRVEKQASTLMVEVRQCRRSEEEWRVQGEEARAESQALQIQLDEARRKKDWAMKELQDKRAELEGQMDKARNGFAEAEAKCKFLYAENTKLQNEISANREQLKEMQKLRKQVDDLQRENNVNKGILKGSGASNGGDALKEVQGERQRLRAEVDDLRPKLSEKEVALASAKAVQERLEADLQQHKFLLGEAQGKVEKLAGQCEGYKAEVGSLRMQMEDAMARAEHAISTLREERDLLHSELERLRNSLQAASAEMNNGLQAVAKLSNVDARTVSSQVRVYGETQGMQNQLHMQMDTMRRQIGALRGGAPSGGGSAGGPHTAHGFGHDEFRPASGRARRTRGGRPDGGSADAAMLTPVVRELPPINGRPDGGTKAGAMASEYYDEMHHDGASSLLDRGREPEPARTKAATSGSSKRPVSASRVHKPAGRFAAPPSRYTHKEAAKYKDLAVIEQAAEWLSAQVLPVHGAEVLKVINRHRETLTDT